MTLADTFRRFGDVARGSSPLYERLAPALADHPQTLAVMEEARPEQRLPMLLFAAVHLEVLREGIAYPADAAAFAAFVAEREQRIRETVAMRRTQTNEVARCGYLLPLLAQLPEPLGLIEVGASAGLNLNLDRFAYRYGDTAFGESDVLIAPELRGPAPEVDHVPRIASRVGIDLAPAPDPEWLRACLWPDQPERRALLDAALAVAAEHPPSLVQGDALALLPELIDRAEGTVVVFHTAVIGYLNAGQRARLDSLTSGVHHVQGENPDGVHDGFDLTVDGRGHGRAGFHGQWLAWAP